MGDTHEWGYGFDIMGVWSCITVPVQAYLYPASLQLLAYANSVLSDNYQPVRAAYSPGTNDPALDQLETDYGIYTTQVEQDDGTSLTYYHCRYTWYLDLAAADSADRAGYFGNGCYYLLGDKSPAQ